MDGLDKVLFFDHFQTLVSLTAMLKVIRICSIIFAMQTGYSNKNRTVPSVKSLRNTVENQHEVNILTIFKCFNRYINEI